MNCLDRVFTFPQVDVNPVPFYKHPYKCFASIPFTLIFSRALEMGVRSEEMSDAKISLIACAVLVPLVSVFFASAHMSSYRNPRLEKAMIISLVPICINLVDGTVPDILDYPLGDSAVIVRVAILVASYVFTLGLVAYANRDTPWMHVGHLPAPPPLLMTDLSRSH